MSVIHRKRKAKDTLKNREENETGETDKVMSFLLQSKAFVANYSLGKCMIGLLERICRHTHTHTRTHLKVRLCRPMYACRCVRACMRVSRNAGTGVHVTVCITQ